MSPDSVPTPKYSRPKVLVPHCSHGRQTPSISSNKCRFHYFFQYFPCIDFPCIDGMAGSDELERAGDLMGAGEIVLLSLEDATDPTRTAPIEVDYDDVKIVHVATSNVTAREREAVISRQAMESTVCVGATEEADILLECDRMEKEYMETSLLLSYCDELDPAVLPDVPATASGIAKSAADDDGAGASGDLAEPSSLGCTCGVVRSLFGPPRSSDLTPPPSTTSFDDPPSRGPRRQARSSAPTLDMDVEDLGNVVRDWTQDFRYGLTSVSNVILWCQRRFVLERTLKAPRPETEIMRRGIEIHAELGAP